MIVEASITGIFRTVLILLGAFVLLRFIGQLMIAKRNMEEERNLNKHRNTVEKERSEKLKNFGRINITKSKKTSSTSRSNSNDVEDVDYEELP